ncbi:acylphosphatase [Mangrovibacterium marinum]|uniref:Acylphosphatase n=1 Tax=Mangrovibacterium marinum TaxID=1639118 RepID=A0A2T5BZX6_9BACT|nr:acylphosphatase [Mangrovibacterium marinum]PTN07873.1 acylphosphatase [Mangrovibacterium marinum]
MSSSKRIHIILVGRVQGVGFRSFSRHKALELKLSGWVRNKMDGSVEIEVEGHPETIARFIAELKAGNGYSRVDRIFKSELPELANYPSFYIKY